MSSWTKSTASGIIAVVIIAVFTPESNWWSNHASQIVDDQMGEGDGLGIDTFFGGDGLSLAENMPAAESREQDSFIQLNPKFVFKLNEMSKGNFSLPRSVIHAIRSLVQENHIVTPVLADLDEDSDTSPVAVRMELEVLLSERLTNYNQLHEKLLKSHSEFGLCEDRNQDQMKTLHRELAVLDAEQKSCQSELALINLGVSEACRRRDEMVNEIHETHEKECYTPSMSEAAFDTETGLPDGPKLLELEAIFKQGQKWYSDRAPVYNALNQICLNSPQHIPTKKEDCEMKLDNFETALFGLSFKKQALCSEMSLCYVKSHENFQRTVEEARSDTSKLLKLRDAVFDIMCLMDDPADFSSCKSQLNERRALPENVPSACDNYRAPDMLNCQIETV